MSSLFLRGFVLGFAVAASPGPIFFLCLRRTLLRGRLYGLVSGLGVATADGFYGAVASFGIAAVATAIASGRRPLAVIGGLVLIGLGARILLERRREVGEAPATKGTGFAWAYLSTLGLTITNPATIISFAALAATLGLGMGAGLVKPLVLVVGVVLGSALWWCVLAVAASVLWARITPGVVRGMSTFSGLAIVILGMLAIYSAFS
ncbi:MAG TPA: LysE family transporter [Candidatus Dormibacteraeota bacterium]|nr:LysE family transporter [Candidatus Dormibacteraeota bacterium]